ncbi:MAG: hypothetical protein AAGM22_07100 [Acidobacteriota bacterium]
MLILALLALSAGAQPPIAQRPDVPSPSAPPSPDATPIEALAAGFPAPGGALRIGLWMGRPLMSASAGELRSTARLVAPGGEVDAFTVKATLDPSDLEGRDRIQVYGDLLAPPGSYELELELTLGPDTARATFPFEVEPPSPDRPSLLPPFFLDDEGLVAPFFEGPAPREMPADYPFMAIGESFVPDISPRVTEEMPRSRVCLIGRGLGDEKTFLESGLVFADGTLLSKERLAAVGHDETDETGYETLCLGLDTQGLEVGSYQLNVVLHDFENKTSDATELQFEIRPAP